VATEKMVAMSRSALHVLVEPGRCWGRIIGEDTDEGACRLCVDACPEVFKKPLPNQCAGVRAGVDPTPHVARIRQAAEICPVNAIFLMIEPSAQRYSIFKS